MWVPTNETCTYTVTQGVGCVPTTTFTAVSNGILTEVLSGAVVYSEHSSTATPTLNDNVLTTGDRAFTSVPSKFKLSQIGSGACVKMQGYSGSGPWQG